MKKISLLLVSILSLNINASTSFEEFYANGNKHILPKEEGNNFLLGYANYLKKLNSCEEHEFNYYNPLIRKKGYYIIEGYIGNKCSVKINYNDLRNIICLLEQKDIEKIINGRVELIKNKDGFGELSKNELEIYFESKQCKINNIEKKVNQKEIEDFNKKLKEENPEIFDFLNKNNK